SDPRTTTKALSMEPLSIRKRPSSTSLFRLSDEYTIAARIAAVVVLIPPPVDPGDAPINIKTKKRNWVGAVSKSTDTVLNPADLVVADWKNAASKRSPAAMDPSVSGFPLSRSHTIDTPNRVKIPLTVKTTCE